MASIIWDYIKAAAQADPLFLKYGATVDRESAYEMLAAKMAPAPGAALPRAGIRWICRRSCRPAWTCRRCRLRPRGRARDARTDDGQPGVQVVAVGPARSSGGKSPAASSGRVAGEGNWCFPPTSGR